MKQRLAITTIGEDDQPTGTTIVPADDPTKAKSGIFTTEFWATIGGIVTNLLVVLGAIGYISQDDAHQITTALSAMFGAFQVIAVNGVLLYQYAKSRGLLKVEQIKQRTALRMEAMRFQTAEQRVELQRLQCESLQLQNAAQQSVKQSGLAIKEG